MHPDFMQFIMFDHPTVTFGQPQEKKRELAGTGKVNGTSPKKMLREL